MSTPAYTRLPPDDRRRQLLERAVELFAEHGYDELSMAAFARAAGISKPLLYHYFPSKQALFQAALTAAVEEHLARTAPEPGRSPREQLEAGLDAYLGWIEEHPAAYEKLIRSAGIPEVRELIDRVREETMERVVDGLGDDRPAVRAAVRGWLWAMDGVCLSWVAEPALSRDETRGLLLGTLAGALMAAGVDVGAALS